MTGINHQRGFRQPAIYQIIIQGELDESWTDWLNGFVITIERDADGVPISNITGIITDQSALRGILTRIWDMNLTLISVSRTPASVP